MMGVSADNNDEEITITNGTTDATASNTYSITVKIPTGTTASGTYTAYQVFAGTYQEVTDNTSGSAKVSKELTVTGWGSDISEANGKALLAELKTTKFKEGTVFSKCTDPAGVADVLSKFDDDSADAKLFANIVNKYVGTGTALSVNSDKTAYVGTGFTVGYYLVSGGSDTGITGNILSLAGDNVEVNLKIGSPTVIKKVYEDTKSDNDNGDKEDSKISDLKIDAGYNDIADYDINETVDFELYGTLPSNYSDYVAYRYIFHDTLDEQFTTDNVKTAIVEGNEVQLSTADTVEVYADSTQIDPSSYQVIINNNNITIKFKDLKKAIVKKASDDEEDQVIEMDSSTIIKVKYSALLTKDAEIGLNGQDNSVYLEYSNNPNWNGQGKPATSDDDTDDKDGDGYKDTPTDTPSGNSTEEETGETPKTPADSGDSGNTEDTTGTTVKDTVRVFTYQVDITKVDGKDGTALEGVTFRLYKDVDGVSNYVTVDDGVVTGWTESEDDATVFETDGDGQFSITGLDDGTYYLEEVSTLEGYNKLKDAVELVISAKTSNGQDWEESKTVEGKTVTDKGLTEWTDGQGDGLMLIVDNDDPKYFSSTDGIVETEVKNFRGTSLPSTGGIGTTMFYVTGGVLVAGAGVTLIAKKRMKDAQ
jgi:LPXTG-motif cell wall-anchored protein